MSQTAEPKRRFDVEVYLNLDTTFLDGWRPGQRLQPSRLNPLRVEADSISWALEEVFWQLNMDDRQNATTERSLSVGDVLRIGDRWFTCEGVGYREIFRADMESYVC